MIAEETAKDFHLESVIFESDRIIGTIDLASSVTDIEIFEHLDKPYLTATIAFEDSNNFVAGLDILGAEKITINIKSVREKANTITKTFFIDIVSLSEKINDNSQFIVFHLIENISYISSLQNINRPYTGTCSEIITKLVKNFLNREVFSTETDKQSVKVIVPNLTPLSAARWISKRATTSTGYPFYFYSTLVGDKLIFADLGTLLEQNVMNPGVPYRFYEAASQNVDRDAQRRTILEYTQKNTDNLLSIIRKGLVGSNYQYIDTLKNEKNKFHFDVVKDFFKPAIDLNVIKANQPNPMFSPQYKHNEQSFNEYSSRSITRIGGSSAFNSLNLKSYRESDSKAEYKLSIISEAMNEFLVKAPMQIDVHGIDFIDGTFGTGVGQNIRLEFLSSSPENPEALIDNKKSGDYLIGAVKYNFKKEGCNVRLSCLKLANLPARPV